MGYFPRWPGRVAGDHPGTPASEESKIFSISALLRKSAHIISISVSLFTTLNKIKVEQLYHLATIGAIQKQIEQEGIEWVEDTEPLESTGIDDELLEFLAENSFGQQQNFDSCCPGDEVDFEAAEKACEESERRFRQWDAEGFLMSLMSHGKVLRLLS